jgi:hypothetical protein
VTTFQFTKASMQHNKKKGGNQEPGLHDIAGAGQAIAELSSIALGMFQDDTPETIHRRRISILKGRYGERGQFFVNWDFGKMDFGEVTSEQADLLADIT